MFVNAKIAQLCMQNETSHKISSLDIIDKAK